MKAPVKKKFLVMGDYMIPKGSLVRQYVSAPELVKLYGLNRSECVLFEKNAPTCPRGIDVSGLFILGPRPEGDYREYVRPYQESL